MYDIFKTSRLKVRNLTPDDFDDFYIMQSNPNVMRYIKPVLNKTEAKKELSKFIMYYDDSEIFYNIWAVENSSTNQFVGILGVYQNKKSEYEIAYRLTEAAWGNGYGTEMADALIDYSITVLHLSKLVAYVYSENEPSIKILEKLMNFVEESPHEKTGILGRKYEICNPIL